jgi:ribonuclease HII
MTHLKQSDGSQLEVGIDEAGRGCLAGPVVAGAVIMPLIEFDDPNSDYDLDILGMVKDSKKMTKANRDICRQYIEEIAIDFGLGIADNTEVDSMNILKATHKSMHRALNELNVTPDMILVDGNAFTDYYDETNELIDYKCVIGGDNEYFNIACASILAKEYHDKIIKEYVENDPQLNIRYGWLSNVCYGTQKHRDGIEEWGISTHHRKTFGLCKGKHMALK